MEFFRAAAVDYDFTLTGSDEAAALAAIARARAAGVKVVLVTGRILRALRRDLPDVDGRFDAIVAENGAVLATEGRERALAAPVENELAHALQARRVPVLRGVVLLATDAAHDFVVLEESRRLGLEVQLVRNRGA
jgi:hydroxymethylpyrimidine pyrophosphatase-like HAD family hydrolase